MEKAALELESKFDDTEKRLDKVQYIHQWQCTETTFGKWGEEGITNYRLFLAWKVAWKVDQLTGLEAGAGETLSTTK